jgi:DNA-binding response OmpR family regulator
MKILIIEDEKALANSIATYLSKDNYLCEVAPTFNLALEKTSLYDYSCIILDITLPDGNGLEILRHLKKHNRTDGVLIISAKNSLDDKVNGLKTGADDYLGKPFHLPELAARVEAIIRRKSFSGQDIVTFNEILINLDGKFVSINGKVVDITRKEYDLLLYLIVNKNRVVSKNAIAEHLWGDNMDLADNYDFIYAHIKNLRRKLVQAGSLDYIQAVYGTGYKLGAE